MDIGPGTLALVLAIASLVVIGLLLHYISQVGGRYDRLCLNGLTACSLGLLAASLGFGSAQALPAPTGLFSAVAFSFVLFCLALGIWREGLRRFRHG